MGEIKSQLPLDIKALLLKRRPTLTANRTSEPPKIDGSLDDATWDRAPDVVNFQDSMLKEDPKVKTEAWVAYDDNYYYIAMRCHNPNMSSVVTSPRKRDGKVYMDDCVDVFIKPDIEGKTYYQFIVNADGALYDAKVFDKSYDSSIIVSARRGETDWSVELAIPWKDINASPADAVTMGFLLSRIKNSKPSQVLQYPVLYGGNHTHELYGKLQFGK